MTDDGGKGVPFIETTQHGDVLIHSEVDPALVAEAVNDPNSEISQLGPLSMAIASWAGELNSFHGEGSPLRGNRREYDLFQRDKYVTPTRVYAQMGACYDALDDDVVSNVVDVSESLAFNRVRIQADDPDKEDVFNQIFRDLDIDTWIRQAWRELFTVSQLYGVRWWGRKTYRVRGKGDERRRRKEFTVTTPVQLGFLDPTRVVPVGIDMFGNKKLAWIGSDDDVALFRSVQRDFEKKSPQTDEVVSSLFVGQYRPSGKEKEQLTNEDIPVDRLLELNSDFVWSHTLTMSPYERWPRMRLKSIFPLLDLKQQVRAMDRAVLLGGINFIVLIKKGTDAHPVKRNAEIDAVSTQVRTQSRSPVIVSDHRLEIEIITPDMGHILDDEKWDTIDKRLLTRLWGSFMMNPSEGRDNSLTLGRVIARGISSRRHMLKRSLERELIMQIQEQNEEMEGEAKIEFTPRRIELEMDEAIATIMQELRDRGDISRESILNELGFDQDLEARRREREKERGYDDIFEPVNVPFDSPDKTTPGGSSRSNPSRTNRQSGGNQ